MSTSTARPTLNRDRETNRAEPSTRCGALCRRRVTWRAACAALVLTHAGVIVQSAALAGPLSPPIGPVTSTQKTLAEIEPRIAVSATNTPGDANSVFRISAPGSYYLTADVLGQLNKHGIEIAASNVTLDLSGFTVDGQNLAGAFNGITLDGLVLGTVVKNGRVIRWGNTGVSLDGAGADPGKIVREIEASNNLGIGIDAGDTALVVDCVARNNGSAGILASSASIVRNCIARENGSTGISVGLNCTIESCTARLNGASGFGASSGITIINSSSNGNGANGFILGGAATVRNCSANDNNDAGFSLSSSSVITGCSAIANTTFGFQVSSSSRLTDCTAVSNESHGFQVVGSGNTVTGCVGRTNGTTTVAANFLVSGSDNVIKANAAGLADYGFWVTGVRNIITQNTSAGASTRNWDFVANNIYGPIIDRSVVNTVAVSGDSSASTTGTSDPGANFTH